MPKGEKGAKPAFGFSAIKTAGKPKIDKQVISADLYAPLKRAISRSVL